jgi:bis(5'-nucleosyl)-tetraphosphatase (symmetrical)
MAIYAIGDIQGCFEALQALLRRITFRPGRDTLWFTGDLVNRGPKSAKVLRLVMDLGASAVSVLGNHDLHLLAVAHEAAPALASDTFQDVLQAPDRDRLLRWLRQRPLLYEDARLGFALVHAGMLPQWDVATARRLAGEVEAQLRSACFVDLLAHMYGNRPDRWDARLRGHERLRVIVNALTRLRYLDAEGRMDLAPVGAPGSQPAHLKPWFQARAPAQHEPTVVFGHWSALGVWDQDGVIGIDSGCLWGGSLTAVRLDVKPHTFASVNCDRQLEPDWT